MQQFTSQKKAMLAVIALLVIGVVLQQYLLRSKNNQPQSNAVASDETISVKADTGSWKEYANTKLGFSVKYPEGTVVRGTAESDLAILTLPTAETNGKQAFITLTKKKVPLGHAPYASIEEFWKDEQQFISSNGGVSADARYVDINGKRFWQTREDNRQNNYLGLHRYSKQGESIYEASLTVEGEKLLESAVELYNNILTTLVVQ